MAFAADTFAGLTAGTSLDGRTASDSGTWTSRDVANAVVGATGGGAVTTANSTRAGYYHSATPASADYSVALDITATSTGVTTMGPAARMDTATNTQYFARWSGSTGWQLWKRVSGTDTQLGSSQNTQAPTTVKTATLTVNGTTISLDVTGASSPLISVTDSAITAAGKAGIYDYFSDTGNKDSGDNFSAAALGVTVALTGQGSTASAGTLSPVNSVRVTGSAVTSSAGTIVPSVSFALSGSAGSLAPGSLNPGLDTALTGSTGTAATGALVAVSPAVAQSGAGGKLTRKLKKRWWQIGDKVYQGTQEQAAKALDAFVGDQVGEGEVEAIRLPSKPAPSRATPKDSTLAKVDIPDLNFSAFDWRSMYAQYVLQRDFEMASALQAAIQRRIDQDEDDVEVILLLH